MKYPRSFSVIATGLLLVSASLAEETPAAPKVYGPTMPAGLVQKAAPPKPSEPKPEDFIREFEPFGKYQLLADGEVLTDGAVAVAQRAGNVMLLQSKAFGGGILLKPAQSSVEQLPAGAVVEELDGTYAVRTQPKPKPLPNFEIVEGGITFPLGEIEVTMRHAPDKLGFYAGKELLSTNAGYKFTARSYVPDYSVLKTLETAQSGVRVRLFFGSWCPACSEKLPRMLRVQKELSTDKFDFQYYGLPSPFRDEPEAKKFGVKSVPTAVILRGDTEIGRIQGNDWIAPEKSLERLLNKAALLQGT